MRRLLTLLLLLLTTDLASAQEDDARRRNPWGRFPIGAWKRVRIRKQTFTADGLAATSVEESKTTLKAADDNKYTLEVISHIKAAGQEFDSEKTISLSYYGSLPEQPIEVQPLEQEAVVELEGRPVKCRLLSVKVQSPMRRRSTTMFLSGLHSAPLRIVSRTVSADDESLIHETISDVRAHKLLVVLLGEEREVAVVHTLQKGPMSIQTTHELHCAEIPGAVVSSWSKGTDAEGALRERVTLELIDFGIPSDEDR